MTNALIEAVKVGLQFKRFTAEAFPPARLSGKSRDDDERIRRMVSSGVSMATVISVGAKALDFYGDGEELCKQEGLNLPVSPMLLVPVQLEGEVADVILFYQVKNDKQDRVYFLTPMWKDPPSYRRCSFPKAYFYYDNERRECCVMGPKDGLGDPTEDVLDALDTCVQRAMQPMYALVGALRAGAAKLESRAANFAVTRMQARKAGAACVEYRICAIDPEVKPRGVSLGGTHASPRWHVRRGHYRSLRSGKMVFVRQCEVGDPERGSVVKDYTL